MPCKEEEKITAATTTNTIQKKKHKTTNFYCFTFAAINLKCIHFYCSFVVHEKPSNTFETWATENSIQQPKRSGAYSKLQETNTRRDEEGERGSKTVIPM